MCISTWLGKLARRVTTFYKIPAPKRRSVSALIRGLTVNARPRIFACRLITYWTARSIFTSGAGRISKKFETRIARQIFARGADAANAVGSCKPTNSWAILVARLCLAPCPAQSARRGSEAAAPHSMIIEWAATPGNILAAVGYNYYHTSHAPRLSRSCPRL